MHNSEPPSDYRIVLPVEWYRIPLDPEEREKSIAALVRRQFQGIDNAPHLKDELRRKLTKQAQKVHRYGGMELYLSFQAAGPITVPASLAVSLLPPASGGRSLNSLTAELLDSGPLGRKVNVIEADSGPMVRSIQLEEHEEDVEDSELSIISGSYYFPIPGTEAMLLLSFSSPLGDIADSMTELFDAVAGSLSWVE